MWLEQFHRLFGYATDRYTGQRQNLAQIEAELFQGQVEMQVGPKELEIIESSSAWTYAQWWPRLSTELEKPIRLPRNLSWPETKSHVVELLQNKLKNIEVVSVALRFLCPMEFGILSPPVTSLICLTPARKHAQFYLHYLQILKSFVQHYKTLERVADVDMALWSAAHLSLDPKYASLTEEMYDDQYFQEVCLRNVTEGFGKYWRSTDRHRILFARIFLKRDHVVAQVIAARIYEQTIVTMAEKLGIKSPNTILGQKDIRPLARALNMRSELKELGIRDGELIRLLDLRNKAVHSEYPLDQRTAEHFVQRIEQLLHAWESRTIS